MDESKQTLSILLQQSHEIIAQLILTEGELTPDIESAIEVNERQLTEKIDSYHFVMERLEKEAEYFKSKADQLSRIASGCKKTRERIKERLKEVMQANQLTELKGQDIRFKLINSQPALKIDESKLPIKWKIVSYIPDKSRIKEELINGGEIEGACLEPSHQLRAYLNRKE